SRSLSDRTIVRSARPLSSAVPFWQIAISMCGGTIPQNTFCRPRLTNRAYRAAPNVGAGLVCEKVEARIALTYRPAPRDTSGVSLPKPIEQLTGLLARNTHENWARQKLDDGWRYVPERNDERKEHPNLVPYEELSEEDKEYDRRTAMETLKAILALGYRIEKA